MISGRNNNEATKVSTLIDGTVKDSKEYLRVEYQPDRPEDCAIEYGYIVECHNPECEEKMHPRLRRIRMPLNRLEEAIKALQTLRAEGLN